MKQLILSALLVICLSQNLDASSSQTTNSEQAEFWTTPKKIAAGTLAIVIAGGTFWFIRSRSKTNGQGTGKFQGFKSEDDYKAHQRIALDFSSKARSQADEMIMKKHSKYSDPATFVNYMSQVEKVCQKNGPVAAQALADKIAKQVDDDYKKYKSGS